MELALLRVILTALAMTRAGDGLPVKSPTDVGMSSSRLAAIERVIERGIKAGGDIWRIAQTPLEARALVLSTPLEGRPGAQYIYSDLGADVLGLLVEVVAGEPLDKFLTRRVFEPLGMNETMFRPADSLRYRIAPTEVTPPRGYPLRGEVHDENAYALGGVA